MTETNAIFWFRRDLRLHDNHGLHAALTSGSPVLPIFIFDTNILDDLKDKRDRRVAFIHHALTELNAGLQEYGASLKVVIGDPLEVWPSLLKEFPVSRVYYNGDYEPYARERDGKVREMLKEKNIDFISHKDHVLFEKSEVVKNDDSPYTVFTPYSRKWKERFKAEGVPSYPSQEHLDKFVQQKFEMPTLEDIGFEDIDESFPEKKVATELVANYDKTRNFPAINGTSKLGVHFRFGTISSRQAISRAKTLNETFLNELIWREFYQMILWHFPYVVGKPFRSKYDGIPWRNNESDFQKWCEGKTGYPLVDAGMRELNTTGYMHNRVRMVVASFLTKHLLIDWRWGEAYFAEKLLDFELASNNGGWQWAAGCGTDAAPYFRVFNPSEQLKKFDKELKYVREWVPEFGSEDYPEPIVEHKFARQRALDTYKSALAVAAG